MTNTRIQPLFKTVRRSQFSGLGGAIQGNHIESNSGVGLSHLEGNSNKWKLLQKLLYRPTFEMSIPVKSSYGFGEFDGKEAEETPNCHYTVVETS